MIRTLRALLLTPLLLAACQDEGTACLAVFQIYSVSLTDPAGDPVTDAAVASILVRTGDTLQNRTLALFAPGSYFVIDDSYAAQLRSLGDSVALHIERGPTQVEAGYRFRQGSCGVEKLSGPASVTVP